MIKRSEETIFDSDLHVDFSQTLIVENSLVVNFFANKKDHQKIELNLDIKEGADVKIVLFDLVSRDITLSLNAHLSRNSSIEVYIASLANLGCKKEFNVDIVNGGDHSSSYTKMYGLVSGASTLKFLGGIKAVKGAKKSKLKSDGRIINFDPESISVLSPKLLIDENDIEASHGAVLGAIPLKTLFYLMSRGLSRREVETLVARGSFVPLIEQLESVEVRQKVEQFFEKEYL